MNAKKLGVIENKEVTVNDFDRFEKGQQNDKTPNTREGDGNSLDVAGAGAKALANAKQ